MSTDHIHETRDADQKLTDLVTGLEKLNEHATRLVDQSDAPGTVLAWLRGELDALIRSVKGKE